MNDAKAKARIQKSLERLASAEGPQELEAATKAWAKLMAQIKNSKSPKAKEKRCAAPSTIS